MSFILTLDVGSSSVKGALYDARARLVPGTLVRAASPIRVRPDGASERDAAALARRVEGVLDRVLAAAGKRASRVRAVGLDVLTITLCGVDDGGRPLTPLYTYSDGRARDDVAALRAEVDAAAVYQLTGCPLHTAYLPARFRCLHRAQPRLFPSARRWPDAGTLLHRRWFGRDVPTSYSVSSCSGLPDRRRPRLADDLLPLLRIRPRPLPAGRLRRARGLSVPSPAGADLADVPFFLAVGGAPRQRRQQLRRFTTPGLDRGTTGALRIVTPGAGRVAPGCGPTGWASARRCWAGLQRGRQRLRVGAGHAAPARAAADRTALLGCPRRPRPHRAVRGRSAAQVRPAARAASRAPRRPRLLVLRWLVEVSKPAQVARLLRPHLDRGRGGGQQRPRARPAGCSSWPTCSASACSLPRPELTSRGTTILALRAEWSSLDESLGCRVPASPTAAPARSTRPSRGSSDSTTR